MTAVSVVIPWRDGCPHRRHALTLVYSWWASQYPAWPVAVSPDTGTGLWRKAVAVHRAVQHVPDTDVLVVADADVIPYQVGDAAAAVAAGAPWACPFHTVRRLTRFATAALDRPPTASTAAGLATQTVYRGFPGGGCVVLPAATWRQIPLDPRFAGWGHEDLSWALALSALAGAPWRGRAQAVHLWHPPAPRQSRAVGSPASHALWTRYRTAVTRPMMAALVGEAVDALAAGDILTTSR